MEIYKSFTFEAAHRLPNVPADHKCARLHGHSYEVTLHVEGPIGETTGWVMDFADLSTAMAPLLERLDHRNLNDVAGLENPTAERLAVWIWDHLAAGGLDGLAAVQVAETPRSGAIYRGPS